MPLEFPQKIHKPMETENSKLLLQAVERLLGSEWESTLNRIESGAAREALAHNFLDPNVSITGWSARDELIRAYLATKGELAAESKDDPIEGQSKLSSVSRETEPLSPDAGNLQKHVVPFPSKPSIVAAARPQPIGVSISQHGTAARAISIEERNQPLDVPVEQGVIRKVTDEVKLPVEDERNRPLEVKKISSSIAAKPAVGQDQEASVVEQKTANPQTTPQTPPKTSSLSMPSPSMLPGAVGSTVISKSSVPLTSKQKVESPAKPITAPLEKTVKPEAKSTPKPPPAPGSKAAPVNSQEDATPDEQESAGGTAYRCQVTSISDDEILATHAALLKGVKYERYRDFILAEGTNSGTGAPSLVICTLTNDWLEFQFPYEEGQRLLKKYPQRDQELTQLIISKSRMKK